MIDGTWSVLKNTPAWSSQFEYRAKKNTVKKYKIAYYSHSLKDWTISTDKYESTDAFHNSTGCFHKQFEAQLIFDSVEEFEV